MSLIVVLLALALVCITLFVARSFPRTCVVFAAGSLTWLCVSYGFDLDAVASWAVYLFAAFVFWKVAFWCWLIWKIVRFAARGREVS